MQRLNADWLMNRLKRGREKCGAKYQRPESTVSKAQTVAAMDTDVSLQLFLCYTFVVLHGWLMDTQYKKKSITQTAFVPCVEHSHPMATDALCR